MSKQNEADLIKNLNPNEKRRLMRQLESNQASPKKKSENPRPVSSKNHNAVPKPFNANVGKVGQVNPVRPKWGAPAPKASPNFVSGRDTKVGDNVVIPKLNEAHVKLFTSHEAANKLKSTDAARKPLATKTKQPQKVETKSPSPSSGASKPVVRKPTIQNKPRPPEVKKVATPVSTKATEPVVAPVAQTKQPQQDNTKAATKTPANKPPATKPPTAPWQRPPLSKDKAASPPTAVVAPLNKPSKSDARQRSVSTPPTPPQQGVSYKSSEDNVVLPNLSSDVETKPQRSLSESQTEPLVQGESPKLGHNFEAYELKEWVNWCDACGSVILSLFRKCVSCSKCKMVCHEKCATTVSLTCEADQHVRSLTLNDPNALNRYKTIVQETKDETTLKEFNTIQRVLSTEEIQERIENFNQTVKGSQQMTLQDNGETFRGFIRVSMNLMRPVSVHDSTKTTRKPTRKASFYIDKGALKALHLTSDTTSELVVQALLNKYSISDNPMKFALFEKQVREEGHVILRKMLPRERPLFLRLLWGNGNSDKRGFILQENESRDIHWESFSIAELLMFIKILDKEENDYITEIKRKYKNKETDIRNAISHQTKRS
ncbi:uncharacterized protein LOC100175967 [Ciona intestinalis]